MLLKMALFHFFLRLSDVALCVCTTSSAIGVNNSLKRMFSVGWLLFLGLGCSVFLWLFTAMLSDAWSEWKTFPGQHGIAL